MPSTSGRIGPARVALDEESATGDFRIDGFVIESLSNFSSARATTAVFKASPVLDFLDGLNGEEDACDRQGKSHQPSPQQLPPHLNPGPVHMEGTKAMPVRMQGKWMYEVILATSGIQQIGWATIDTPFTTEEGVGDAPNSYAWDGKRVQRWNVSHHPYGSAWSAGDIIGVCVDMEAGTMRFTKNGIDLGGVPAPCRPCSVPCCARTGAMSGSHVAEIRGGTSPRKYIFSTCTLEGTQYSLIRHQYSPVLCASPSLLSL